MGHGFMAVSIVALTASAAPAHASSPAASVAAPAVPVVAAAPYSSGPQGLAVVAFPGATDAAWPLAQAVYADRALRPIGLDETRARILCGDTPPANAPPALRDLAQTVAALRGDDAPTRLLLGELARRFSVRALVSVWSDGSGHPTARVFLAESGLFDAARYAPDEGGAIGAWSGATRSFDRLFAAPVGAPPLSTHEPPTERDLSAPPFYQSVWFWGGIGAAAAAAAAIYLTTRDSSSPTIHLEVQVPR